MRGVVSRFDVDEVPEESFQTAQLIIRAEKRKNGQK